MKLRYVVALCLSVGIVSSACGGGGDSLANLPLRANAPDCISYEGPNLPVDELKRLNEEATSKHAQIQKKYGLPDHQAQVGNTPTAFDDPAFVAETAIAPRGSFQRYTEFVCDPGGIDPAIEKAMREKIASFEPRIEELMRDAQYKDVDMVGFAREARSINNEYSVLNVVQVLQYCGRARYDNETVAEMLQRYGGTADVVAHTTVLGAEILCPDIAGELPPLPVNCGELALNGAGEKGTIEVRVGEVDCDKARQVITDSWKQLTEEGAKGVYYEVNDVAEYVCNIAGAAASDSEGFDYKCDSPMGDKVITWTED